MWLYLLVSSALKGQSRHQDAGRNHTHMAVHFPAGPEPLDGSGGPRPPGRQLDAADV